MLGLWANDISAELAESTIDTDNTYVKRDPLSEDYSWVIHVKSEDYVRLKNVNRNEETELRVTDITAQIRSELRERDRQEERISKVSLLREASQQDSNPASRDVDIKILMSQNKGKKVNRKTIVEEGRSHNSMIQVNTC